MKLLPSLVALLLPWNALIAADFRTLDFGEACVDLEANEYQLGNSPQTASGIRETHHVYHGVFLDRAVTIKYFCGKNGTLEKGAYVFDFSTEADLETFFSLARSALQYRHGAPAFDGAEAGSDSKNNLFRYDLRWEQDRTTILVKVVGNFEGPEPKKQLYIWFRPARWHNRASD